MVIYIAHNMGVLRLFIVVGLFKMISAESQEICTGEHDVTIRCQRGEIIMMTSAEYGRMNVGRCIRKSDEFMGCSNDVLPLLDKWCSGHRECTIDVPNDELERMNEACLDILIKYLKISYSCLKVNTDCSGSRPTTLITSEGIISSQSSDTRGCGSTNSPWIISAKPGQTINISIIDFNTVEVEKSNLVSCHLIYGFIVERSLGINYTICGGRHRQMSLYTSKTNQVQIQISSRNVRADSSFLLKYEVTGCPELSRPPHTWYKREGNQAVIGCETNNEEWRLTCKGNKWIGEVGNCTEKVTAMIVPQRHEQESIDSVVVMTGIAGGAVVLCVIAIVVGTVYIKKYRMHQETKHLSKTYASLESNQKAYYRPVNFDVTQSEMNFDFSTLNTQEKNQSGRFNVSEGQNAPRFDQCTCATLPARACNSDERETIYNSIKST